MMNDTDLQNEAIQVDTEKGNFSYPEDYQFDAGVGLNEDTIKYISDVKNDDEWVREFRLSALEIFEKKPMPTNWADEDLNSIDFDKICLLYTSPSPRDRQKSRMPASA